MGKKKEHLVELEELTKTDPEAAAQKLAELEKVRIEERASLKHRNASKFLHDQAKRSKITKSKEAKETINQQLRHHRDLLTKHGEAFDDDAEEVNENSGDEALNTKCELLTKDQTIEQFHGGYKKFWEEQQKKRKLETSEDIDEIFDEAEFTIKQKTMRRIEDLKHSNDKAVAPLSSDAEFEDDSKELIADDSLNFKIRPNNEDSVNRIVNSSSSKTDLPNVDPDKFMNVEPKDIGSDLPEIVGYDELEEENDDQRDIIAEAFAEDDVVESFKAEKAALIESRKPKDIDLTLPGWGEWGGGGAMPSKRKRKRFTVKAPPAPKRKDENSGHLILNCDKDEKLRAHQVSNVPFPFTSISDYEASIRAPVGATFIPRTAHLKMVKPRVSTKAGTVIEPMD